MNHFFDILQLCACKYLHTYVFAYVLVMCSNSTGMASELGIGSLLACSVDRLSFLVGCLNLGDLLVDSLVLVDRLLYSVTNCQ